MMAGSPGFQSPEQLRAESLGPLCDVWLCSDCTDARNGSMAKANPISNSPQGFCEG